MSVLFMLDNAADNNDTFRYVKMVVENLPESYDCKVIFANGCPADLPYQLLKKYVAPRLCFVDNSKLASKLVSFIDRNEVASVVVFQSQFNGCSIVDVLNKTANKPSLVYVGNDCSAACTQSATECAAYGKTKFVSTSIMVSQRFMPELETTIIPGAAIVPESSNTDIRKEFSISPKQKIIGFIGNLDDVNTDIMVEVARRLSCGLLIAGVGSKVTALSQINGPVKIIPMIPQYRYDFYKAIDVLIYPSRGASWPTLIIEAIMCLTPVAMTPVADFYRNLNEYVSFFGMNATESTTATKEAMSADMHVAKLFLEETYPIERMVTSWMTVIG